MPWSMLVYNVPEAAETNGKFQKHVYTCKIPTNFITLVSYLDSIYFMYPKGKGSL